MNAENVVLLLVSVVVQWFTAAGMIWLTWWAAQSRDAPALRVIALVLVVVPALFWPVLTFSMTLDSGGSASRRIFLIGVVSAGVMIIRALLLTVWAIVSKDRPYLRIGGGVIAFLSIAGLALQGIGSLIRL